MFRLSEVKEFFYRHLQILSNTDKSNRTYPSRSYFFPSQLGGEGYSGMPKLRNLLSTRLIASVETPLAPQKQLTAVSARVLVPLLQFQLIGVSGRMSHLRQKSLNFWRGKISLSDEKNRRSRLYIMKSLKPYTLYVLKNPY